MTGREILELVAAGLLIATTALATHRVWAALAVGAIAAAWFAHGWEWTAPARWPWSKRKGR